MFLLVPVLGTAIAHELGHFAVANLLRLGPRLVSVGIGPPLIRVRIGPTNFVLRLVPFGSHVACVPPSCSRLRSSALVGGGVLGNLVGVLLLNAAAALRSVTHAVPHVPPAPKPSPCCSPSPAK